MILRYNLVFATVLKYIWYGNDVLRIVAFIWQKWLVGTHSFACKSLLKANKYDTKSQKCMGYYL